MNIQNCKAICEKALNPRSELRFLTSGRDGERNDKLKFYSDGRQYFGALQWRKEAGTLQEGKLEEFSNHPVAHS